MSDGIGAGLEEEEGEAIAVNAAADNATVEMNEAHDNATVAESKDTNWADAHSVALDPLFFDVFPTNKFLIDIFFYKDQEKKYMKLTMMGCQKLCWQTETVGHSKNAVTGVGASIKTKSCCLQILTKKVLTLTGSL